VSSKTTFLVVAAVIVVWGILGIMDSGNLTYSGYTTDALGNVIEVEDGSPADAAGFAIGDRVTSFSGVSAENLQALNELPRSVPGSSEQIGLQRDGQSLTVTLVHAEQTGRQRALETLRTRLQEVSSSQSASRRTKKEIVSGHVHPSS